MKRMVHARLMLMLLLIYGMFGAWFVTLGTYMGKGLGFEDIIGTAYSLQGIAIILSTLFVAVIADRYLAAEKLLALLALASAGSLALLSVVHSSPALFLAVLMLHFLVFLPILPLSNTIALGAISDVERVFPRLRLAGTLAWIVAGLIVGSIQGAAITALPMRIGAILGIALALYATSLPHTPPRARGEAISLLGLFGLDFVAGVRDRAFWSFIAAAFLLMIPLTFYYAYANTYLEEIGVRASFLGLRFEPAAIQTLGQFSELLFLLVLPGLLVRHGIKTVILIGMAAWVLRYVLFAFAATDARTALPMVLAGIFLHGVCQDFFAVAGQIYIDGRFSAAERARAQSFLALVMGGLGSLIGANLAGAIYAAGAITPQAHDWRLIWLAPALFSAAVFIFFALLFRDRSRATAT